MNCQQLRITQFSHHSENMLEKFIQNTGIYEEFHLKTRYIHFGQFEIFEI